MMVDDGVARLNRISIITALPHELLEYILAFCYVDLGPSWRFISPSVNLLIRLTPELATHYSYWRNRINTLETDWYYGSVEYTAHWNYSNPAICQK